MKSLYKKVKSRTKEAFKKINGKEISDIFIDYYVLFDNEILGRFVREKNWIIYDKFFIDNSNWDLIETLIIHECCHARLKEHRTQKGKKDFQKLFNQFKLGSFDVGERPSFQEWLNKMRLLGVMDINNQWVKKNCPKKPIKSEVFSLLKSEGILFE